MWFDPLTAWVVALFTTGLPLAKEKIEMSLTSPIPAENWGNKELYEKDRTSGMSSDELMRNVRKGKYRLVMQYAEPHQDPKYHKTIIENDDLYKEDVEKYGVPQAHNWMRQGKYNLNEEELEIKNLQFERDTINLYALVTGMTTERKLRLEEINKELAAPNWNYRDTEALRYWRQVRAANNAD